MVPTLEVLSLFCEVFSVWIMSAQAKVGVNQKRRPKFQFSQQSHLFGLLLCTRQNKPYEFSSLRKSKTEKLSCVVTLSDSTRFFQDLETGPNRQRPSNSLIPWKVSKGLTLLTQPSIRCFLAFQKWTQTWTHHLLVSHVTCAVDPLC